MKNPDDAGIISPEYVECQAFNVGHVSIIRVIKSASFPAFLDVFADFIIGNDGEPMERSGHA